MVVREGENGNNAAAHTGLHSAEPSLNPLDRTQDIYNSWDPGDVAGESGVDTPRFAGRVSV